MKKLTLITLFCTLTACQSTPKSPTRAVITPITAQIQNNTAPSSAQESVTQAHAAPDDTTFDGAIRDNITPDNITPKTLPAFHVNGKIGIRTPDGGSGVFYDWQQTPTRADIEFTVLFSQVRVQIDQNGARANYLGREHKHPNAEALFAEFFNIKAPIDHLPYWIAGQTKGDEDAVFDNQNRVTQATHDKWQVKFDYRDDKRIPHLLTLMTPNYRISITINPAP